jgi:hypothetical protein
MNLFILDTDPALSTQMLCDQHILSQPKETAQMLCASFRPDTPNLPCKPTHVNHRCTRWVRTNSSNFYWTLIYANHLLHEYEFRYRRKHACGAWIEWCRDRFNDMTLPEGALTPFAQAVPQELRQIDPVAAYRAYYLRDKQRFATWERGRPAPAWWRAHIAAEISPKRLENLL